MVNVGQYSGFAASAEGPAAMGERERTITGRNTDEMACFRTGPGGSRDRGPCKGCDSGKGKSIVFGNNAHHPGSQAISSSPRVRDFEFTFVVDGQEGRLAWGHSLSTVASTNEPIAWAISGDNKSVVGADTDDHFQMTVMSPDRIEMCYSHNGLSPTKSIVATCYVMERAKK